MDMNTSKGKLQQIINLLSGKLTTKPENMKYQENGEYFMFNGILALTSGDFVETIINTPSDVFIRSVNSELRTDFPDFKVEVYEDTTYTGGIDTTSNAKCLNREVNNTPDLQFISGATIVDQGNLFYQSKLFGSTGIGQTSNGAFFTNQGADFVSYILRKNTTYLIRSTNDGTEDGEAVSTFFWYEYAE